MIIGFTGTQEGMTDNQHIQVQRLLHTRDITEAHHGDCIGADSQFHDICKEKKYKIIIHPPLKSYKRSFKNGDIILPKKDYLDRNKDIVDDSEIMIGTPKGSEELRSGTWSTIRYAKRMKKELYIVYPNGDVEHFHEYT